MKKSDKLEEEGNFEYCKRCASLALIEIDSTVVCQTCGTVGYTEVCTEEEYVKNINISNESG